MKKFFSLLLSTLIFVAISSTAQAATAKIDTKIKDQNGCIWHIKGTVTFDIIPPKLTGYDVVATDCNGNSYHFVGTMMGSTDGTSLEDFDYTWMELDCPSGCDNNGKYFVFDVLIDFVNQQST